MEEDRLSQVRKNRNSTSMCSNPDEYGVDLNRNYDYKFGFDDEGSKPQPCAEDYRGEFAFSELETQAVRDFVGGHSGNIKLALNFHAWGDLWIMPYNYDANRENLHL